jgi:hypothetical protein
MQHDDLIYNDFHDIDHFWCFSFEAITPTMEDVIEYFIKNEFCRILLGIIVFKLEFVDIFLKLDMI